RRIVLNLKAMSRSEDESTRRVEVNGAIASAAAMLDDQIRRCARLQLDLGDVPAVPATEARIAQVLLSLLQNAVQAIEPGQPDAHTIRVRSFATPEGQVAIEVSDTGEGIAPEH